MKSVYRNTSNAILFINIQIQTEIHETPYLYSSCDILASGVYVAYHIFQNPSYIMCIPPRSSLSLITFSELIAHRSRYHAQHKRNPSPTLACQYAHWAPAASSPLTPARGRKTHRTQRGLGTCFLGFSPITYWFQKYLCIHKRRW